MKITPGHERAIVSAVIIKYNSEFEHGACGRWQAAKMTSEFVLFSSNP